ncbi:MAG: hypothetical protein KC457_00475 [Myxococcales bacterium]|nr:hypothetical protein [Myxococcales bacterium]
MQHLSQNCFPVGLGEPREIDLPSPTSRMQPPEDPRFRIEHEHGYVEVRELAPGVFVTRYYGTAPVSVVDPITEHFDQRIGEGHRICMGIDATDLAFFEAEFRRRWTDWMRNNKAQLDDVHLLFSSRLVMMGAALVNATIGPKIKSFAVRDEFEAAMQAAIDSRSGA